MALGVVGARLLFALEFPERFPDLRSVLDVRRPGFSIIGGLTAGIGGLFGLARVTGIPLLTILDVYFRGIPLVQVSGRIGCFVEGCCYGLPCTVGPGICVTFPTHSPAWRGQVARGLLDPGAARSLPVHAAQLYDAAAMVLVFLALQWWARRPRARGELFALYLMLYALVRFTVEFARGDEHRVGDLWTPAQLYALVFGPLGALLWWLARRGERTASPGPK